MGSPPKRSRADCTAARAPDRRSTKTPSHQALAWIGRGWPPHSCKRSKALRSSMSKRSVSVAGATGKTLIDASNTTPKTPIEPAIRRAKS